MEYIKVLTGILERVQGEINQACYTHIPGRNHSYWYAVFRFFRQYAVRKGYIRSTQKVML